MSVRTAHLHFPNADSQIVALGERFDRHFFPACARPADGPDALARYFRDIHANTVQLIADQLTAQAAAAPSTDEDSVSAAE